MTAVRALPLSWNYRFSCDHRLINYWGKLVTGARGGHPSGGGSGPFGGVVASAALSIADDGGANGASQRPPPIGDGGCFLAAS